MPRKLKVYRTPIGFDDAYVAAPSRKAALAAWGSDANLFARGVAEEVTDPKLMTGPLAAPGEVIRLSRGDLKAQLKALPPRRKAKPAAARIYEDKPQSPPKPRRTAKPKPPPSRRKLEAAEAALSEAAARHEAELDVLDQERQALAGRIETLRRRGDKERERLEWARDAARQAYRRALEKWSE